MYLIALDMYLPYYRSTLFWYYLSVLDGLKVFFSLAVCCIETFKAALKESQIIPAEFFADFPMLQLHPMFAFLPAKTW